MKSEAELKEWIDFVKDDEGAIHADLLKDKITGMKLVPAGTVVLSVEDVYALLCYLPNSSQCNLSQLNLRERINKAIELARGK